jgi:hypothetical protein
MSMWDSSAYKSANSNTGIVMKREIKFEDAKY